MNVPKALMLSASILFAAGLGGCTDDGSVLPKQVQPDKQHPLGATGPAANAVQPVSPVHDVPSIGPAPLVPHISEYSNSGCLRAQGRGVFCDEPGWFELEVVGSTVDITHHNVEYNCCPDDIVVELTVEGHFLHVEEYEVLSNPCFCLCCYDVYSTVADLAPGGYVLEYCWWDCTAGGTVCETFEFTVD